MEILLCPVWGPWVLAAVLPLLGLYFVVRAPERAERHQTRR